VREAFGIELPLRAIFDAPTIATLAVRLSRGANDASGAPMPPLQPTARDGDIPLSFAQQRLWFLHRLDPQSAFYNVPLAVHVRGPLDIAALQHAANTIVARHEALRTRFEIAGDQPVQRIAPAGRVPMPIVSLETVAAPQREAIATRLVRREIARPFDLAVGPVFRITVLRTAPDDHVIVLLLHHIVSDAWSMGVLLSELGAAYTALAAGTAPMLPPLPVQYADFAVWQRQWLTDAVIDQEIAWWREQVADVIPQGDLFPRKRRGRGPSRRRGSHGAMMSPELAIQLKRLSRQRDATLFMTLLAALDVVLHAETGRTQFLVGTNVANRRDARLEPLVGFFINQLALRADLTGDPSFAALLDRIRGVTLGAYDHQDLPFDRLIEALRLARDPGRYPLFQVIFAFENAPAAAPVALTGLDVEPFAIERRETVADLILTMTDQPNGLSMLFEFDSDLFEPTAAARLAKKLVAVLETVVADSTLAVSAIVDRLRPIDRAVRRTKRQSYAAALKRSMPPAVPGA
jgi:hypothetical protein